MAATTRSGDVIAHRRAGDPRPAATHWRPSDCAPRPPAVVDPPDEGRGLSLRYVCRTAAEVTWPG